MSAAPARQPLVTAAAVVLFVVGALNILSVIFLFRAGGGFLLVALLGLAVGAAAIYAGTQILALREQGRVIGLAIAGIGAVLAVITLIGQGNWFAIIGLLLYGFVIWVLTTNRESFS